MSKFNCRSTFKISAILEKDDKTPKESHQYRTNRTGRIFMLNLNAPMFFTYSDGHGTYITSTVEDFQEDDCGITVTTKNSIYRLDAILNNK
jgi:hypothetical protein